MFAEMKAAASSLCVLAIGISAASLLTPTLGRAQQLEEIVVTAQKRAENLQDTPLAITAFDSSALERSGIDTAADLAFRVPNLQFNNFSSLAFIAIRGVGYENTTAGGDPGVAFHLDGLYLARPTAIVFDAYDMERMEVLRGPQGTLYGRNATGGSVNFITQKPTDELDFFGDLTLGDYARLRVRSSVNVPLSDAVAARLSVAYEERDGFQENSFPGGTEAHDADNLSFRGQLKINFSDKDELLFRTNFADIGGVGSTSELREVFPSCAAGMCAVFPPGALGPNPGEFDNASPNDLEPHSVSKNTPETNDLEFSSLAATYTRDLEGMTFKSITGWAETSFHTFADLDSGDLFIMDIDLQEDQEQISQEFQLLSNSEGPWQWLVGAYFFTEEATRYSTIFNDDFNALAGIGAAVYGQDVVGTVVPVPVGFQVGGAVEATSYALFSQVSYELTDALKLTAGLRFSWDDKDAIIDQISPFAPVGNFIPPNAVNGCPCITTGPPPAAFNLLDRASDSWSEPTYKVVLDWAATDDVLLYGLFSRGYKSGGANLNAGAASIVIYDPEFIDSFEVGAKTQWAGRFQVNAAAYVNDYKDVQVQDFGPNGAFIDNAAEATINGLEIEGTLLVTDTIAVDASVGLLDTEYDQFLTIVNGLPADFSGNKLSRSPETTFHIGGEKEWGLVSGGSVVLRVDYHYQDDAQYAPSNAVQFVGDSYDNLDIRVFYASPGERFTAEVYGTNVTDEEQVQSILPSIPFLAGQRQLTTYGPPRQVGVRFGYRFKK